VVTLLQDMQKKVDAEGARDKELFDKYMCYCTTGAGDLKKSVAEAETKLPAVTAALKEAKAQKAQLDTQLAQHTADRGDAKQAIAEATAIREKEAATYAKDSGEHETNIAAMGKAIATISTGMSGSFLQSSAAGVVRRLTIDMDLSSVDRDVMSSFLSEGQGAQSGYAPQSGQIVGILKQMKETMEGDLADLTKEEEAAKATFGQLLGAKEKEIAANSKAIEAKTARVGRVGVEIETTREDLEDTSASYEDDKKFLADLEKNCATKKQEFDVVQKTRAEELLAIAETIKLLNDDDALDLFKKTLPSPSLLQMKVRGQAVRQQALRLLRAAQHGHGRDTRLDLITIALRGKKVSFEKVLAMIDEMVALLGKEQATDDDKKAFCEAKIDEAEDKKKELDLDVADLTKAMEEAEAAMETLGEEIAALEAGIKALDKSVSDATETRKAENEEFKSTMAANTAAKELIGVAKNRMNKFYNPSLYKPPPKRELSAEDRIAVNMGGTPPPTAAPGGIAGTGITYLQEGPAALVQVAAHARRSSGAAAPPPPPETFGPYTKKGQESNGALTLMDMLIADLDKEMSEMGVEEKDAQVDYEQFVEDSAAKRAADSKSIEEKESAKADTEAALGKDTLEKKSKAKESYATAVILKDLHLECDWLLSNFQARKEARAGEVDSLKKAKAVLSGADYALLQMAPVAKLRGNIVRAHP